jgi:hypothetical protein
MQQTIFRIVALLCLLAFIAAPAGAFTAESLHVEVVENGDAGVRFTYSLSFLEHIAVFLRIADPAVELKHALEGYSKKPVDVTEVSSGSAAFHVYGFASVSDDGTNTSWCTPELDLQDAQRVLETYWFAPLISPDFSPAETLIIFPDGYVAQFEDISTIPSLCHTGQFTPTAP